MGEVFKVNGNINEWIRKSETCLKQHGFDNIIVRGLKGELEATYKVFDNITIRFTPLLDGKVELNIEASNPQLITMYKNGIMTASKAKQTYSKNQVDDEQLIHYAPKFEQSPDFYGGRKKAVPQKNNTPASLPKQKKGGGCFKIFLIGFLILFVLAMIVSCLGSGVETTVPVANTSAVSYEECGNYPYESLARTPDTFKNQKIKFSGTIVQVIEEQNQHGYRIAIDDNYEQIALVSYQGELDQGRILENDMVEFWGIYQGVTTYQSTFNAKVTVPYLLASGYSILQ